MSRAAAAQSGSTTLTPAFSTLLVLRGHPNGSSSALVRSEPLGNNGHPVGIGALVMLLGILEYSDEKHKRINFISQAGGIFRILEAWPVWTNVFGFLLHDHAWWCMAPAIAPECFPNADDRLTTLTHHLENTAISSIAIPYAALNTRFFSKNYQAGFEFAALLDAALNADLAIVKKILTEASLANRRTFLSATGRAVITHLNIERTGTPLQMAIYDHDEEMVAFFKEKMDSKEFDHQSKSAFRKALTFEECAKLDHRNASALEYYQAMQEQQNKDAEELCVGLKNAFEAASPGEFAIDSNYVASTTSTQLPGTIDAFINELTNYVQKNPVHNLYILQHVYEIYNRLLSDFFNRNCYFLQRVIGGVQSFLSARWLQHYAQGIDYLADNNETPRRAFICCGSSSHIDIRLLVGSCIGADSFLDMFGSRCASARGVDDWPLILYKAYVEQKQHAFGACYDASAIDSQLRNPITPSLVEMLRQRF